MKLMTWSLKGGVGKSSIALNISLEHDFGVITNDYYTPLKGIISEENLKILSPKEKTPQVPNDVDVIFDYGGYVDSRAIDALKQSDFVLIPVVRSIPDIKVTIPSIQEIERYNKNIILIANKSEPGDYKNLKELFSEIGEFHTLEIKKSEAINDMFVKKKSIHQIVREGGIKGYHFKKIANQFDQLTNYIKENKIA